MVTIDWATGVWLTILGGVAYVAAGDNAIDVVPIVVAAVLAFVHYGPGEERERRRGELQRRMDVLDGNRGK